MQLRFHKSHRDSPRPGRALLTLAFLALLCVGLGVGGVYLWAEQQLRAARRALEQDDLDTAQHYLERCLTVRPKYGEALLLAARTARRRGAVEDAERYLKACEESGKSDALVLERVLLSVQQGEINPSKEQSLYRLASKNDPDTIFILEALALGYMNAMRMAETGPALNRLLERAPKHFQAYLWRGKVRENINEYVYTEAYLADYEEAVRLRPDSNEPRQRLASSLYRVGRLREAAAHFELLRDRSPTKQVLLGLAKCRFDLHQLDQARHLLDALLGEDEEYVPALVERGRVAFRLGQIPEAEKFLQKAVKVAPNDREAHAMLYRYLNAQNKKAAAQKCLDQLDQIDGQTLQSLQLMKRMMVNPSDPAPRYELGMLFFQTGHEERGVQFLKMALACDSDHAPSKAALAEYYKRAGMEEQAAAYLQERAGGP